MVKESVGKTLARDRVNDVWYLKQITQACRDGELDVYTSVLSIAECTHTEQDISPKVKTTFESLLMSGQYVKLVQLTPFIATDARDLRWVRNIALRGADSIHVASALDRKCDEFITTDGQLQKIGAVASVLLQLGMRIIRAHQTQCLPAKYLQLGLPVPTP
jgi:predicted nucleic acid-binding protein